MPPNHVKEIDTTEFEIALEYWMNHFNFVGNNFLPAADDESIYPDPKHQRRNTEAKQ
jgi:hypothetical protein